MDSSPTLYEWLSHPLLLLTLGGLLSGYLIPVLTRRWQDHQKELDIKSDLVRKISESVISIVMAVQFADIGRQSQSMEDFDKAYREWELDRAVIGSQLRAYFPRSELGSKWDLYASLITDFDILTTLSDESSRRKQLEKLESYFEKDRTNIVWDSLVKPRRALIKSKEDEDYQCYRSNWTEVRDQVLLVKDDLIMEVLESSTSLSRPSSRRRAD